MVKKYNSIFHKVTLTKNLWKRRNQRIRNRNFFIIGEHIIDPHNTRNSYSLNHILEGILNGLAYKQKRISYRLFV